MTTLYSCQICGVDMEEVSGLQLCEDHEMYIEKEGLDSYSAHIEGYGRISPRFTSPQNTFVWMQSVDFELLEEILEGMEYAASGMA